MERIESNRENEGKLRNATLVFLVKTSEGKILDICLAMKKRGFGMNRWNGVGGKVEKGEEIFGAAQRETKEEIGVETKEMQKVAELSFSFPHNTAWDQMVHVYLSQTWDNEPKESDEMKPQWFSIEQLPFDEMWPGDKFWIPEVLSGNLIKASFTFGEGDVIIHKDIQIVEHL